MNRRNFIKTSTAAVNAFTFPLLDSQRTNPKSIVKKVFIYGGDFDRGLQNMQLH